MPRYIDEEAVKHTVNNFIDKTGRKYFSRERIFDFLFETKSADVQKVKHGKWIRRGYPNYVYGCSECSRTIECWSEPEYRFPYCHCGAKMDGGKNDEN